jgi:hypothetical protein
MRERRDITGQSPPPSFAAIPMRRPGHPRYKSPEEESTNSFRCRNKFDRDNHSAHLSTPTQRFHPAMPAPTIPRQEPGTHGMEDLSFHLGKAYCHYTLSLDLALKLQGIEKRIRPGLGPLVITLFKRRAPGHGVRIVQSL